MFSFVFMSGKKQKGLKPARAGPGQLLVWRDADDCCAHLVKQIAHIQITLQSDYLNEMLKRFPTVRPSLMQITLEVSQKYVIVFG